MFRSLAVAVCAFSMILGVMSVTACEHHDNNSCKQDPQCDLYGDKCAPRCKVFNANSAACNKTVFCSWAGDACAIDCGVASCNETCHSGAYATACYWHEASNQCKQARGGNGNQPFLSTTVVAPSTVAAVPLPPPLSSKPTRWNNGKNDDKPSNQ
jgi:hypothetical protein